MLFYRARLDHPAETVLAVTVRSRPATPTLGGDGPTGRCRVVVRYADRAGVVRSHCGDLAVPSGVALQAVSWQLDGSEALVSLRPGAPAGGSGSGRGRPGRGCAATLRLALPVALQAWSVTAVTGATVGVRAVCRPCRGGLLVRGRVFLRLSVPGAELPLRIPFARLLALETEPGLRWRAGAGVTGLHVKVAPGGAISGEVVVAVRCEGRPAHTAGAPRPDVRSVREVSGRVASTLTEPAGAGHAVVRGAVDLDVYWVDGGGHSRWTGRSMSFAALLELPGAQEGDRLEAVTRIDRLTRAGEEVHVLLQVTAAALRSETVALGGGAYRLERQVAAATAAVEVAEPLWATDEQCPPGREVAVADLPLPGPAGGWQEVVAALTPSVAAAGGAARWRVGARLGGTPAGEAPYPAPLRAGTGGTVALKAGQALSVLPTLLRVDPRGVRLATGLLTDEALPEAPLPGAEVAEATLPLPGPASGVTGLTAAPGAGGWAVSACVRVPGHGLRYVSGHVTAEGEVQLPAGVLAYPMAHSGAWLLRVLIYR